MLTMLTQQKLHVQLQLLLLYQFCFTFILVVLILIDIQYLQYVAFGFEMGSNQAFTNCLHGYDRACNGVTRARKFVHGIDLFLQDPILYLRLVSVYLTKNIRKLSSDILDLTSQLGKISLNRSAGFTCKLYQHDFRIILIYVFIYQQIFHCRVKTGLKDDFVHVLPLRQP